MVCLKITRTTTVILKLVSSDPTRPFISERELIAIVGLLMALNAFSIDIILPALPNIAGALGSEGNAQQLLIITYVMGFGAAQLLFGPITDALGRRTTLILALVLYAITTLACLASPTMGLLLAARAMQGVAAAGTRVVAMAMVRDLVSGRKMAEIISFAMTVFMIAPILAPSIGQGLLLFAPWQSLFLFLLALGGLLFVWSFIRLPETLPPERRQSIEIKRVLYNFTQAASHRVTMGYMLAASFVFGALFVFLATSEQVISELYGLRAWFGIAFGGVATALALASIFNARLVGHIGVRRISHIALLSFIVINAVHTLIAMFIMPPFWVFYTLLTLAMMLFAMIGANFSALAMEPAEERAGTTAALYGSVTSILGAGLGAIVGQAYNGSVLPLIAGMTVLGMLAFITVYKTEKGQLFTDPITVDSD